VKLWTLGSGSKGNAILVECDGSRLLVDCGFGIRTLTGRLRSIGVEPASIETCLLTHEHSDHVKGAGAAAARWRWDVYATAGTAQAPELQAANVHRFAAGETLGLPRMTVAPVATPHDANEPVGFVITSRSTGARAALFYDLGHVSAAIAAACDDIDILVLESNHDENMLRAGPYPRWLQERIAGPTGHLSNRDSGTFARTAAGRGTAHLVLAHLSENCNTPDVALKSMRAAVGRSRFRGAITAARQDAVVGPFMPVGARAEAPTQYALAL
jgi:phosphoribosyl 1,2-cyclic phosphodiesterase